ncbi:alpha/beta hydrolase family protein [Paraburkholderia eburnea]|uniref:Alpha/beta hydrolase family protein n=1 Tax=Paraburkholderia eburnea TaxID=1189126 RepID=A0A2S4M8L9_9BURK|nr:alpha/beta hydrolase [Paraburkholderia eburnea]POR51082.1 alpha/beta hydrolase family protein [Paraburkholderia eburnea]PRZ21817.1 alpha/beta hydrolase family protein [Paraburkholderia eburnea]
MLVGSGLDRLLQSPQSIDIRPVGGRAISCQHRDGHCGTAVRWVGSPLCQLVDVERRAPPLSYASVYLQASVMRIVPLATGDSKFPTLVCLPGAMCSPFVYKQCAVTSGLKAEALAWLEDDGPFDLNSIANRIVDAISDDEAVILVGHSLGTPLAVLAALKAFARGKRTVKGLVLSNSGANTKGHGDAEAIVRRIREDSVPRPVE